MLLRRKVKNPPLVGDDQDPEIFEETRVYDSLKNKRLGVISTSIFSYLTPPMIIITLVVSLIIVLSSSTLYMYFETNMPLNGLIIFLLCFGLYNAFYNNFQLYQTAKFVKKLENTIVQDVIEEDAVDDLHVSMVKKAPLIDTQSMHDAIENLRIFGHPNFTDNDAQMIKHKLGYRIRLRKSDVGFLAGILVMLGLLGTFLGLLKTIDAVGLAMNSMGNMGGDEGVTEDQMTSFISSLSAPLQGMGLAFSSSLFGLSGSLLIGFFNHLCGGAQDKFIENMGRWIDERIPKFDPKKGKNSKPASTDDLKTWLAGFVYLSVKTNKKMSALTYSLIETVKSLGSHDQHLSNMSQSQNEIAHLTSDMNNTLTLLSGAIQESNTQIQQTNQKTHDFLAHTTQALSDFSSQSTQALVSIQKTVEPINSSLQNSLLNVSDILKENASAISMHMTDLKDVAKVAHQDGQLHWNKINDGIENIVLASQEAHLSSREGMAKINASLEKQAQQLSSNQVLQQQVSQDIGALTNAMQASASKRGAASNTSKTEEKLEKLLLDLNQMIVQVDNVNESKLNALLDFDINSPESDDKVD